MTGILVSHAEIASFQCRDILAFPRCTTDEWAVYRKRQRWNIADLLEGKRLLWRLLTSVSVDSESLNRIPKKSTRQSYRDTALMQRGVTLLSCR